MKLFFKSYRNYLIFFLLITWESGFSCGMAQESSLYLSPWIQEINLPSQYNEIPNISCYKDQKGTLFLGKENGLTIISGKEFNHLHMNGPVYVTGGDSDTLLYAAENDLGYLIKNKGADFHIISRKHLIPSSQRTFKPSDLIKIRNNFFINTNQGVYHLLKMKVRFFPFQGAITHLHRVNNEIYLSVEGMGVLLWTGEGFREIVTQEQLGASPVMLMSSDRNTLQILTRAGIRYSLSDPESDPQYEMTFPMMDRVTFMDYISNEQLLVKIEGEGISIMDIWGAEVQHYEKISGLAEVEIRQILSMNKHEIWILTPHSLHKINYPSPLEILKFNPEKTGQILNSEVTEEQIILGTSNGIFSVKQKDATTNRWQSENLISGTKESIHLLSKAGSQVFAAGLHHLYVIKDSHAEKIDGGSFTGIQAINQNTVIVSGSKGLTLYKQNDQAWQSNPIDPSLSYSHSFVILNQQIYFLSRNGVFRLSQNMKRVIPIQFHTNKLLFRLEVLENELFLITIDQVYQYEKNEETFLPLTGEVKAGILSESEMLIQKNEGSFWIVQNDGLLRESENKISYPVLQNLGKIIDLNYRDSVLFITGKNKVSLFDLRKLDACQNEFTIQINQVSQEKHRTIFSMTGLEFQCDPAPLFRHRLLPGQEQWSKWDIQSLLIFNDLKPGNYKIEGQSMDLYGQVSTPKEYTFKVMPPFHRTWYAYTVYALLLLIILFLLRKLQMLSYQRAESRISQHFQIKVKNLTLEKEKSDKLVAEILPERTADQLKTKGKAKWDKYERATVLFSDIQGFTKIAEEMNPETLIDELDKFFFHFDSVVEKYNIEKIKTIGDAYMAAGGIPKKNSTNPVEVVMAALEMQSYMQDLKSSKANIWDLRIGIHTGPVIAGVVGHKKVSYDIWGDTVNTASRMESSGIPGKINISGITYGMVKEYFLCEYRGKLPVKYKGNIDMYFVNGLRPELTVNLKEIPNKRFVTKLQLLRLGDLENLVFETILLDLPEFLHFHNIEYARKIYMQSFLLCRAEEIEQEDRLLVRTAALMLFTGHTQSYNNFENRTSVICREILPDFQYSETQVDQICNLILATKLPLNSNNHLEKILIDAKMDYIGRPDYTTRIKLLLQEMQEAGSKINGQQFKKQQLEILYEFEFFTVAGQRLREVSGTDQMAILEQERWI